MQPFGTSDSPHDLAAALLSSIYAEADRTDRSLAADALGDAFIVEGQLFLDAISTSDDVELFFETYGKRREKSADGWVLEIVTGLPSRLSPDDLATLGDRALRRAITRLAANDK